MRRIEYPQSAPARTREEAEALDGFDRPVREIARSLGAREMQYSALIARDVLAQAEYPQAFANLLMSASRSEAAEPDGKGQAASGTPVMTDWCLSPAVCYHAYGQLAGSVVDPTTVITARGRCFRAESESAPGIRQIEFEMREIVLLGQAAWVDASAERVSRAVETIARGVGLSGRWQVAEDPFFLPAAHGKALMQRMLKVKREYQWPGAGGLALASVNRHGAFFGRRFDITTPDGQPVHTACIAVGLDRWAHHALRPNTARGISTHARHHGEVRP